MTDLPKAWWEARLVVQGLMRFLRKKGSCFNYERVGPASEAGRRPQPYICMYVQPFALNGGGESTCPCHACLFFFIWIYVHRILEHTCPVSPSKGRYLSLHWRVSGDV